MRIALIVGIVAVIAIVLYQIFGKTTAVAATPVRGAFTPTPGLLGTAYPAGTAGAIISPVGNPSPVSSIARTAIWSAAALPSIASGAASVAATSPYSAPQSIQDAQLINTTLTGADQAFAGGTIGAADASNDLIAPPDPSIVSLQDDSYASTVAGDAVIYD